MRKQICVYEIGDVNFEKFIIDIVLLTCYNTDRRKEKMLTPDKLPRSVSCDEGLLCIEWESAPNEIYSMEIRSDEIETTIFRNLKVEIEQHFKIEEM